MPPINAIRAMHQITHIKQMPKIDLAHPVVSVLKLVVNNQHKSMIRRGRDVDRSPPPGQQPAVLRDVAGNSVKETMTWRFLVQVDHACIPWPHQISVPLGRVIWSLIMDAVPQSAQAI